MMWSVWFLVVGAALSVEATRRGYQDSYAAHDQKERLTHGRQLKIYLPKVVEKLEFMPASSRDKVFVYVLNGRSQGGRGHLSGSGNDRKWYLDHVTFDDEGTYISRDFFNNEISVLRVAVITRNAYIPKMPGQTLTISLEGMRQDDATLIFRGLDYNMTLVKNGAPVGRDSADYYDRLTISSGGIYIKHVNTTDLGVYTLYDSRDRVVSTTKLELRDYVEEGPNPLMALLLLLGIPAGICCCCRKKIFKSKSANTATCQGTPEATPGPPPPGYNQPSGGVSPGPGQIHPPPNPGMPGPQWNGPPPNTNPGYAPPQNPLYPPIQNPAAYGPPAPGYGPPPAQYNPGGAPMYYPAGPQMAVGYAPAPMMYSAPPPSGGEAIKMENISPTDPLLAHAPPVEPAPAETSPIVAPPPVATTDGSGAYQFDVGKGSTNFL